MVRVRPCRFGAGAVPLPLAPQRIGGVRRRRRFAVIAAAPHLPSVVRVRHLSCTPVHRDVLPMR